ncbi:MAG: hypothetical protein H6719_07045 [Sandaracinaceae bacterium]|nr:hypothetical protein [Sandaracinaceae bacterium]
MSVHPTARTWALPPARDPLPDPLARVSLRELAAREGRLEHHLTVVARTGVAQLEIVAASEPLFFAHQNISDEYVLPLRTGDAMVDAMPMLTFLSDPRTGEDVARLRHRAHDLILHPYGLSHWPGRLRPPFTPPAFPPGFGRRTGLSLVFCASTPTPPPSDRRVWVTEGREADAKPYVDTPPLLLAELEREPDGVLATVGDVTLSLASGPFAPPNGGWVVVLEGDAPDAFAGDLVRVPPGASFDARPPRALLVTSETAAPEPPPRIWDRVAEVPFEAAEAGALPVSLGALELHARSATEVEARLGGTRAVLPRYWLARMLYRVALHTSVVDGARTTPRPCFGHVETYGGFFYDDREGAFTFGLRGAAEVAVVPAEELLPVLARAYAAVAPAGHTEDLRG